MLNIIWPLFIIISLIYAIFFGRVSEVNLSIFDSVENAVQISINLLGTICLWNGIIKIAMNTELVDKLKRLLKPILKVLFPEIKEKDQAYSEISMNIVANIMGLGNAATPLGLNAMKSMQKENLEKDRLSNSMAMFIIINTASIQIIPTTVIAIRTSLGSKNPTGMILAVWIATIGAAVSAIIMSKILMKRW
jgi:spore maturation protein A